MNFTDNVVEFMLRKITDLGEELQHVLKLAACIGSDFDLKTLSYISGKPMAVLKPQIWRLLKDQLIITDGLNADFAHYLTQSKKNQSEDISA